MLPIYRFNRILFRDRCSRNLYLPAFRKVALPSRPVPP